MGQPDDEPPRSHEACRIEASLRLATVVWSVLLVVAVQLMFAFDHASLVDADRRYLEALHGRAVSAANVTALYASTLKATDGGACLAPREKSCLDGFCSAGDWRDYRRSPLFGCRGGLGAGLPSYELLRDLDDLDDHVLAGARVAAVDPEQLALVVGDARRLRAHARDLDE